jgi:chromate transporter
MTRPDEPPGTVSLATIVREWGRIGCIGFGGPPAHIRLLRDLLGALAGGVAFIVPGLIVILMLAALFLGTSPPRWVLGAGAGAGSP